MALSLTCLWDVHFYAYRTNNVKVIIIHMNYKQISFYIFRLHMKWNNSGHLFRNHLRSLFLVSFRNHVKKLAIESSIAVVAKGMIQFICSRYPIRRLIRIAENLQMLRQKPEPVDLKTHHGNKLITLPNLLAEQLLKLG